MLTRTQRRLVPIDQNGQPTANKGGNKAANGASA